MTDSAARKMEDQAAEADGPFQAAGRIAGWLGLAPFIVLSLWLYGIAPDHPWRSGTILLLLVYSAVVLSFLGGVRWGVALKAEGSDKRPGELWLALPPALIGWMAVIVPAPLSFAILAVAFAALGAWDALAVHRNKLPEWYGRLRMVLTAGAVAMLLLAFASTS